jgi:NAD(P)-dependent dehydrogenase (short-subunit alcohol dehydrogenase family)
VNVLVTGASSGIGAGLARGFAADGHTVGICARRKDRLEEVLADCQKTAPDSRMWVMDLSDLDAVTPFAEQADDELGGIDLLINNAGIPKRRHALQLTPDVVDDVMAINYASPVRLTLALLPRMIKRGSGRILTISSVAARFGPPREAAYSASKAALSAFMESLAVDLDGTDIKINLVNPGIIDTELFHLPDNETSLADLDALPVQALVDAVKQQIQDDVFEIYVPDWFKDIAANRYGNLGQFIEGSKDYTRERVNQMEAGA